MCGAVCICCNQRRKIYTHQCGNLQISALTIFDTARFYHRVAKIYLRLDINCILPLVNKLEQTLKFIKICFWQQSHYYMIVCRMCVRWCRQLPKRHDNDDINNEVFCRKCCVACAIAPLCRGVSECGDNLINCWWYKVRLIVILYLFIHTHLNGFIYLFILFVFVFQITFL